MTKKILSLILLATLFVACGDDDEKEYYNPIEGDWRYTTPLGNTETRVYTDKFDGYTVTKFNGKIKVYEYGSYLIDANKVYFKDFTHKYKIVEDTLWLESTTSDWTEKYIRIKE